MLDFLSQSIYKRKDQTLDDQNALDDKSEIHGQDHCLVMTKLDMGQEIFDSKRYH